MAKPLDRSVVEVAVRDDDVAGQRFVRHRVPVVLRRDVHAAALDFLHGVVAATVSKLQLVGLRAQGPSDDLVSQADAQRGHSLDDGLRCLDGQAVVHGVPRPRREDDAVRVTGQHLLGGGRRRKHAYLATPLAK